MIVRKRYNGDNLVWEFEFETPGEGMDIILIMRKGISALVDEMKDNEESMSILKVWDKAVGVLTHANPEKHEVFERRYRYEANG